MSGLTGWLHQHSSHTVLLFCACFAFSLYTVNGLITTASHTIVYLKYLIEQVPDCRKAAVITSLAIDYALPMTNKSTQRNVSDPDEELDNVGTSKYKHKQAMTLPQKDYNSDGVWRSTTTQGQRKEVGFPIALPARETICLQAH